MLTATFVLSLHQLFLYVIFCLVYWCQIGGGGGGGGGGYGLSVDDHNSLHPQFVPNCNAFDHCNKSSFLEILEARKVSFAEISNSK
jgi:hypothetical protein